MVGTTVHKTYQMAYCLLSFLGTGLSTRTAAILHLGPTALTSNGGGALVCSLAEVRPTDKTHPSLHRVPLILVTLSCSVWADTPLQTKKRSAAYSLKRNIPKQ